MNEEVGQNNFYGCYINFQYFIIVIVLLKTLVDLSFFSFLSDQPNLCASRSGGFAKQVPKSSVVDLLGKRLL